MDQVTHYRETLAILARLSGVIRTVVADHPPEWLLSPSYCTDWCIGRVIAHVGAAGEIMVANTRRQWANEPMPADLRERVWDRFDAMTPIDAAAEGIRQNSLYLGFFNDLTDDDIRTKQYQGHRYPMDMPTWLLQRLQELAIHVWDIQVMIDSGATVDAASAARMIDVSIQTARYITKPVDGTVRFDVEGRSFLRRAGDPPTFEEADGDADLTVSLTADQFVRLIWGRFKLDWLAGAGIDGNRALVRQLDAAFTGF